MLEHPDGCQAHPGGLGRLSSGALSSHQALPLLLAWGSITKHNRVQAYHLIHILPLMQPAVPLVHPASSRHCWTTPAVGCPSFILRRWQRGLSNEGISKHCSLFQKGKAHKMTLEVTHTLPKWHAPLPREAGCSPPHPVLYLRKRKHCFLSFYSFTQVAPSASHCCQPHLLCRELIYSPGGLNSLVKPPRQGPDMLLMGCSPKKIP